MKKVKNRNPQKIKDVAFYCALLAWPLLQFAVMYIFVNLNSFLMAAKKYEFEVVDGKTVSSVYYTFENFANVFKWIFGGTPEWVSNPLEMKMIPFGSLLGNSLLAFLVVTGVSIPLGLMFSYYIYKKFPGSKIFRVLLFMPSILSAMIMCNMFAWFDSSALKLMNFDTGHPFATILVFNIFLSFGVSVLMFTNQMSSVSPETVEAGKMDGVNAWQEFWHILLPHTYSTLTVFLVTNIASIFINQYNIFAFYGAGKVTERGIATLGYWLFSNTYDKANQLNPSEALFPLAAIGLVLTAIIVPITLLSRWLLRKFGPSED